MPRQLDSALPCAWSCREPCRHDNKPRRPHLCRQARIAADTGGSERDMRARTRRLHRNKYRVDQLTGGLARQGAVLFSCPLEVAVAATTEGCQYPRPSPCHQYIGRHAPVTTVTGPAVAASTASPQEVPASVPEAYL